MTTPNAGGGPEQLQTFNPAGNTNQHEDSLGKFADCYKIKHKLALWLDYHSEEFILKNEEWYSLKSLGKNVYNTSIHSGLPPKELPMSPNPQINEGMDRLWHVPSWNSILHLKEIHYCCIQQIDESQRHTLREETQPHRCHRVSLTCHAGKGTRQNRRQMRSHQAPGQHWV